MHIWQMVHAAAKGLDSFFTTAPFMRSMSKPRHGQKEQLLEPQKCDVFFLGIMIYIVPMISIH